MIIGGAEVKGIDPCGGFVATSIEDGIPADGDDVVVIITGINF